MQGSRHIWDDICDTYTGQASCLDGATSPEVHITVAVHPLLAIVWLKPSSGLIPLKLPWRPALRLQAGRCRPWSVRRLANIPESNAAAAAATAIATAAAAAATAASAAAVLLAIHSAARGC